MDTLLKLQMTALGACPSSVMITDTEGRIQWVNDAFIELTGFSRDEAVGRTPGEVLKSGRQPPGFYRDLWDTIRSGKSWRGVVVNQRRDGTLYTEDQLITPILDDEGNITYFVAIKQNIAEDAETAASMQAQAEQLRIAGRFAKLGGSWSLDPESGYLTWSDEVAVIHEEPPGTSPTLGQTLAYFAPEWQPHAARALMDCAYEGRPFDEEMELVTAQGRRVWVHAAGEAVYDDLGRIVGVSGALHDITREKQTETDLQ